MEPISLHIFAKNRDATAVEKGYEYQRISTLLQWLYNKVNKIPEDIYYDYGDDIFGNDEKLRQRNFRQLKLYDSKSFSFASEEVKKALAHFFLLFWQQRQQGHELSFVFETNSGVAEKREDNGAELLSEWHKGQSSMSADLIQRCIAQCKPIVDAYIESQYKRLVAQKDTADKAKEEKGKYDALGNGVWEDFISRITWIFDGVSSDEALEKVISNAYSLIDELPFPIGKEQRDNIFARLYREVGSKSTEDDPANRCLNADSMDNILLSMGDNKDQNYKEVYEKWQGNDHQLHTVGRFYEILNSAKYCRQRSYLKDHAEFWKALLQDYLNLEDFPITAKRQALYEVILLTLIPTLDMDFGSLIGMEPSVEDFFKDLERYDTSRDLEDTLNLLTYIITSQRIKNINLSDEYINQLVQRFDTFLSDKLNSDISPDEKCRLWELQGFFHLNLINSKLREGEIESVIPTFRQIIDLLPQTSFYPISQLSKRIKDIIEINVRFGSPDTNVQPFEDFQEEIDELILPREGSLSAGQTLIERGVSYLEHGDRNSHIKAINYFHKAKILSYQDDLLERFVLSCLNISQFYTPLGYTFAAKYYGLSAYWVSRHSTDPNLFKRLPQALAIIRYADFTQGAWLTASYDFYEELDYKFQFDPDSLSDGDQPWLEAITEIGCMLHFIPKMCPPMSVFIEFFKTRFGQFYTDEIKPCIDELLVDGNEAKMEAINAQRTTDRILNDVGAERVITWEFLQTKWQVRFANDYITNAVAEEFIALLQVMQAEIELNGSLALKAVPVFIEMKVDEQYAAGKKQSGTDNRWRVASMKHSSTVSAEVNAHYQHLVGMAATIFRSLSTLSKEDFAKAFNEFIFKNGLDKKTLTVNSYQRIFYHLIDQAKFDEPQRTAYAVY